jgi:hypothetical protein
VTEAGADLAGSSGTRPAQADKAARFLVLHGGPAPLLMPNPWDAGSAKLLASLGFEALATTSSGFAATLGRLDGAVSREEALAHAASIVAATDLPVSADLENCFADDPPASPRRSAWRWTPGWPGARSRTSAAGPTPASMTHAWRPSGWRRPPRPPMPGRST